jgi:hypothetical protein
MVSRALGARHEGPRDDASILPHHLVAVGGLDIAQVDLALAQGATVFTLCPPWTRPDIQRDAAREVGQRVDRDDLVRGQLPIALMPASKLPPECAALPSMSTTEKTPPLRPVTTLPSGGRVRS